MQQLHLIQSGCQQWIKQPAAIQQSYFAVSSSLAIYVHAADDYRLLKILPQHDQQLSAVCWSPVDAKLLACGTAKQVLKVYQAENEAVVYSTYVPGTDIVKKLCWSMHDEGVLLAYAGAAVGCWSYKTGGWKTLRTFVADVTCMQQSATATRLLAVGCADCTLHLYDLLERKVVCTVRLDDGVVPCDVQFDPLSRQYVLLLCRNGSISMYGVSEDQRTLTQVHSMEKQPAAERSAAFVPNQPGNFVSISNKTGVLQLWNVSQQQPLKSIKAGKVPAQSVQFFPGTSKALLTFQDGTVMVYDVSSQESLWSTQPGHTETIFDCCYAPHNHHLLATCSYDGSVRVWDTASGDCVKSLEVLQPAAGSSYSGQNQATVLYSVAWSPDGSQLAASSAGGAVYLFDYNKGVAVKKWQIHTKASLRVAWHPTEPILAASSLDGVVTGFKTDGTKVRVLRHPTATFGCAWHPKRKWILATTSEAGPVYLWDLNVAGDSCLQQTLTGHDKKSFSVAWSPLLDDLLLSAGDDATARVWDVKSGTCLALLVGHQTEVRALCWHPEIPWLVFTGSWDSTIRAWDIRSRQCTHTCHSHYSDVYGLSIHASCPWVMASASRDTTVRLWDLRGLAAGLMVRCFLDGAVPRGQAEEYATHSSPLLCGPASQELATWCSRHLKATTSSSSINQTGTPAVNNLSELARVELFQRVSDFFCSTGPAHALWQLAAAAVAHLSAAQGSALSPGSAGRAGSVSGGVGYVNVKPLQSSESCGFQHMLAARQALTSAANQLELSAKGRQGAKGAVMGTVKKEDALHEAAIWHLQAGNVEKCCDLLVELQEWDTALALAPAVSPQYWCKLLQMRADAAAKAGAPVKELLPMLLVSGQTTALIELLKSKEQYGLAANIASVQACGGYQHLATSQQQASHQQQAASQQFTLPSSGPPLQSQTSLPTAILSPTRLSAATSGQLLSPMRTLGHSSSLSLSPITSPASPAAQQQQQAVGQLPLMQRRTRDSLPPLRVSGALAPSNSNLSPGAAAAAATVAELSATARSRSLETGLGSPSVTSDLSMNTLQLGDVNSAAPAAFPARDRLSSCGGSFAAARIRSFSGMLGGAVVTDSEAAAQLSAVRQAQALASRRHGQPLLAACASLTVSDVAAAVTALHLGNEPEQAATLVLALGQLGGVDQVLQDRVFAALATKCEVTGDWSAAAAATRLLSKDAQHHLQLLVVRHERFSRKAAKIMGSNAEDPSEQQTGVSSYLRQHIGLKAVSYYAAVADSAEDPLQCVRYLLLAANSQQAADKALTQLQPLVQQLEQRLHEPTSDSSKSVLIPSQLLQVEQVQQLLLWQDCLESLDAAALTPASWHEVFSYCLLSGALRAFAYGYFQVGSYLMTSLRRWTEQHQVQGFPVTRAGLLLLEAEVLSDVSPEGSWSLLNVAADAADAPDNVRLLARRKLQTYPRPAVNRDLEAGHVIAAGSSLPCRAGFGGSKSAISGKPLTGGAVRSLDDGASIVSMSEAVMLSHVMRMGPHGTGMTLQLL